MEMGKIKKLFSIAIYSFLLLSSPLIAYADIVPWTSESYNAYVNIYEYNDNGNLIFDTSIENYGPPLPVSASYNYDSGSGSYGSASSFISNSNMYVQVAANENNPGYFLGAYAEVYFEGSYTASSDFFQLSFDNDTDPLSSILYVFDETDSSLLYNDNMHSNSGILSIPTKKGNDIYVNYYLGINVGQVPSNSASLDYNMAVTPAVVPEPISSILFVTGGGLLAGIRFIRRKA